MAKKMNEGPLTHVLLIPPPWWRSGGSLARRPSAGSRIVRVGTRKTQLDPGELATRKREALAAIEELTRPRTAARRLRGLSGDWVSDVAEAGDGVAD